MFRRVELVPFGHRTSKLGNDAHANYLQWERKYWHLVGFGVKLSHDKDAIDFSSDLAWEIFQKTWEHEYRRIF